MKKHGAKVLVLGLVFALFTACGGGGDGDNPLFPTQPIQSNAIVNGVISPSDVKAPDGTYADLYTITVDSPTLLNIRLESSDFDVYLVLFDGAVLNVPNLSQWDPYFLAENDDIDEQTTDAGLTYELQPGMYVIVVNNFEPGSLGAYTLTTSTSQVAIAGQFLQYRVYEGGATGIWGWIQFRDNGEDIQASQILSAKILHSSSGAELIPAAPMTFLSASFVLGTWNPSISQFDQIVPYSYTGVAFNFSNYPSLPAGNYTFTAIPATGALLSAQAFIPSLPQPNPIQVVGSASMAFQWNPDGSLLLSWTPPENPSDDYRIVFRVASTIIFHGVVRGANQVILQPSLVQQISQSAGIALPTTVQWVVETRNFSNDINYERGHSGPVAIDW
jgi:hypothetical protein